MQFDFFYIINWLATATIVGYLYSTPIFLLLCLIFKKIKERRSAYLNIANILILPTSVYLFIIAIINFKECFSPSPYCIPGLLMTLLLGVFFQLLFLLKKYRVKVWATTVSLILLLIFIYFERIVIYLTSFYRDYLPSSWTTYYGLSMYLQDFVAPIIFFAICWFFSNPKKNQTASAVDAASVEHS